MLVQDGRCNVWLEYPSAKRQGQQTDDEWRRRMRRALLQDRWKGTKDLDQVRDTADQDTYTNGLVSTDMNVGPPARISTGERRQPFQARVKVGILPSSQNGKYIGQKGEQQHQSGTGLQAHSQPSSSLLRATRWSTRAIPAYKLLSASSFTQVNWMTSMPFGRGNSIKLEKTV